MTPAEVRAHVAIALMQNTAYGRMDCNELVLVVLATLNRCGWQVVPKEATEEMNEAGYIDTDDVLPADIYWKMLEAAPKLEEQP